MSEQKLRVVQQVLDPSGSGGVSAEYRALQRSSLLNDYEFVPMILKTPHNGVNLKDIAFYYRFLRETAPDIVHIRGAAPDGLNAVIAAKLANKGKILVSVHGMYSDLVYISKVKRWISYHIVERLIFGLADGISCVCRATHNRNRFDRYRKKMLPYVYNRIPDFGKYDAEAIREQVRKELGIGADATVGVYVGRVTKEKGLDYLIAALESIPEDCLFLVVGDGAYLEEMQSIANENVIFLGEQKDVYRYLFASDFFVQPSLHENHSIALLEAAAAGIPIIATDVGGNKEIVRNNVTGILVAPGDCEKLCQILHIFWRDQKRLVQFKTNALKMHYGEFEDNSVDEAMRETYQEILRGDKQ